MRNLRTPQAASQVPAALVHSGTSRGKQRARELEPQAAACCKQQASSCSCKLQLAASTRAIVLRVSYGLLAARSR